MQNNKDRLNSPYVTGSNDELNQIIKWLRGPHIGSDTAAWQEAVKPLYDEIADQLNRGEHWNG